MPNVRALQRNFLSAPNRLPVAASSSRVSGLGYRVSLFPHVEELWRVDLPTTSIYEQTRRKAGRSTCPAVVIMDGPSVKTTERGGVRGFDAHKHVKGHKRHILVDTLGLTIACRVEPANISDRRAGSLLFDNYPRIQASDERRLYRRRQSDSASVSVFERIKSGCETDREGRPIIVQQDTPFYAFILCDVTPTLKRQARYAQLRPTPDSRGFFGYNSEIGV
jgi:hypothetical protein